MRQSTVNLYTHLHIFTTFGLNLYLHASVCRRIYIYYGQRIWDGKISGFYDERGHFHCIARVGALASIVWLVVFLPDFISGLVLHLEIPNELCLNSNLSSKHLPL